MKYYFFLGVLLVSLTACKKNDTPVVASEEKKLNVLGWVQTNTHNNFMPALWTAGRELNFLPTLPNAHYKMSFCHHMDGKLLYFGIEDVHSPASSKAVMWQGTEKTVLSERTLSLVQQERINGISVNPTKSEICVLASSMDHHYYYQISEGGRTILKTTINAGAHGTPVYIQATGSDIHLLTVTQIYSDELTNGKTIIRHLKNDVVYATYELALNEEEYLWNNLQVGSAFIENDVCHLLAASDQSLDYYYLRLSKNAGIVQRHVNTQGYTPSFGAETGSITSASGVFNEGRFYVAAKKEARDIACLIIDVRPALPEVTKMTLEASQLYGTYTPVKTYKFGDDLYLSGVADNFGVYWKNGKLVVPDKTDLSMSRIAHISYH